MAKIYHADLYGSRKYKYQFLSEHDVNTVQWIEIQPNSPAYFFVPYDQRLQSEYQQYYSICDIFGFQSMGITSGDDGFLYDFSVNELKEKINQEISKTKIIHSEKTRSKTQRWIGKIVNQDWKTVLYRPFDQRAILYCPHILARSRPQLNQQFNGQNLGLVAIRRSRENNQSNFFVTQILADKSIISSADNANIFPLYIHLNQSDQQINLIESSEPNLTPTFLKDIENKLDYQPTPEAIFYYIYAILHSPTYRQRYAEFLRLDFPRIPLTEQDQLFRALGEKGQALVALHGMKSPKLNHLITRIEGEGDNTVTEVTYKSQNQRIYINKTRYFEGIKLEVWQFKIGGYQVLDKWLKDRKKAKRTLSFDDAFHFQKIVVAITETLVLMTEIDVLIPGFPII